MGDDFYSKQDIQNNSVAKKFINNQQQFNKFEQTDICQNSKNFQKPIIKKQLQQQNGFVSQVGNVSIKKSGQLGESVGQLNGAQMSQSAFQRRQNVGIGAQVMRQQSVGPIAGNKVPIFMQRCISVPQTQTIRRGGDDYRIGSIKQKKDDGAPVKNLIAFFERQN
eukprot:TRINITY_DN10771_c1_g1_i1.p2 TRINITY_DN10771_c1_g1~~TRINITY_DN10771_c1_g1_i1.p2  ORF type:complete len:165 (+),score=21.31 TRINITY_DN10771_c1_g1_i1:231-725(+)